MSDDISIPMAGGNAPFTRSYHSRRAGPDLGTRRLIMAAGVLILVLLAGIGAWAVIGRRPATVPVIEADARPLRVKPDNPGGMQVVGADEQVMGGSGGNGTEAMAPAPEAPAPQALRAQMQPPPRPAAPAAPAPASVPAPAPMAAAPAPATTPPPAATVPAPALRSAAAPQRPATGAALVQLAAVDNEAAAQAEWQRLAKKMPDLLGDRRAVVQKAERDGHSIWRLRTGGFADIAEATGFCAKVRAKGGACAIASF